MNPYYQKDDITIYHGNALDVLKVVPDESVQLIISSPPYLGLRSYLLEPQVWDGDKDCVHSWLNSITTNRHKKGETNPGKEAWYKEKDGISQTAGWFCSKCGAWLGCLGLEPSVKLFLQHLLQITAELKRVLTKTGCFFLNMGDSYGGSNQGYGAKQKSKTGIQDVNDGYYASSKDKTPLSKLTPKCLLQIPQRLSIKMVDEQGWILRNDIIYAKQIYLKKQGKTMGSAVPTSTHDRFNQTHEHFYFFTKNKKYYSNLDEVRIPNQVLGVTDFRPNRGGFIDPAKLYGENSKYFNHPEITRQPQFEASEKEIEEYHGKFKGMKQDAEMFGSPRARNERQKKEIGNLGHSGLVDRDRNRELRVYDSIKGKNLPSCWLIGSEPHNFSKELKTDGTEHFATFPSELVIIPILFASAKGDTVLDCFCGSGTVGIVAQNLNRKFIGIELSQDYIDHIIIPRLELNSRQLKFEF